MPTCMSLVCLNSGGRGLEWVKSFYMEHEAKQVDLAHMLINNGLKVQHLLSCRAKSPEEGWCLSSLMAS